MRIREATFAEIKAIARSHLVEHGPDGVSLRAIAREMGMTAPALYRYFSSLGDLLLSLQADLFAELSDHITDASAGLPADDVDGRLLASLRAFRTWALANRAEFALLFGPRGTVAPSVPHAGEALRGPASFPPGRRPQLELFAECAGFDGENATEGALRVLTACWVRLYGLVCMEVFRSMPFVVDDMEPLFEAELRDLLTSVGVHYRPPRR